MYAAIITAKPQPKVMASQPALRALDFFSVTAAHAAAEEYQSGGAEGFADKDVAVGERGH
ncbi:hypothetical protein ACFQ0T_36460 [Kitasatospora gansuensis]